MQEIWGVIGTEGVFEEAPSVIHAEAWERYGGTLQWPINGKRAVKREDGVFWEDGSPVQFTNN